MNTIVQSDSLDFLKTLGEHSNDIMYCDPPYALGSEVIVRPDGKVDYAKASDFMGKWEMPTGEYWEQWFKEAYRTLKHGGHLVMFGMDRQLLLFKYYGHLAGFTEKQSMYWYFISNFPKATDLSKMIDKNAGVEMEKGAPLTENIAMSGANYTRPEKKPPSSDLAKKYDGYKYSVSPLKQTNETIMVFQKPYKTGSCLHDTLAYENGDTDCTCGALDIGGNKVGTGTGEVKTITCPNIEGNNYNQGNEEYSSRDRIEYQVKDDGRYPAQTFINDLTAEVLDRQSGAKVSKATKGSDNRKNIGNSVFIDGVRNENNSYSDTGGCSKILHKCNYEDHDLYFYQPKVSKTERNAGCDGFEDNKKHTTYGEYNGTAEHSTNKNSVAKNNHPTLKPIALNEKILRLFKTPCEQTICYPFAGAGSEIIGGLKAGFDKWVACELSEDYIEIANARIKYWSEK